MIYGFEVYIDFFFDDNLHISMNNLVDYSIFMSYDDIFVENLTSIK